MKKTIISAIMLVGFCGIAMAQDGRVGINTPDPKTSMDVRGKTDTSGNSLTTDTTGFQAPRLTRAELTAKGNTLYGTDQKGALVYITDVLGGDTLTQRVNITTAGYYYFDGSIWQSVKGGTNDAWKTLGNSGTTRGTNYIGTNDNTDLMFKTNGKYRMHINNHGGVVIGDSAQVYNTNMANGFSGIRADFYSDDISHFTGDPANPQPGFGIANKFDVRIKAGTPSTGSLRSLTTAISLSADNGASKPGGDVSGASIYAYRAPHIGNTDGTGTIAVISGLNILAGNGSGSVGPTSRFYGVNLTPNNQGAGTITDYFGYYMGTPNGTTGTITNKYGVYIANDWSNYFNGKVGIGTAPLTAPTNQLHVKATTDPVRFEGLANGAFTDNVVTVDANGVLKKISPLASGADFTNDAWINNSANSVVELGTKSDGTTARDADTGVALNDKGALLQGQYAAAIAANVVNGNNLYNVSSVQSDNLPTVASGKSLYVNNEYIALKNGFSPGSNITGTLHGVSTLGGNTSNYALIRGFVTDNQLAGSGTVTNFNGLVGRASTNSGSNVTNLEAVQSLARIGGTGTVTNAISNKSMVQIQTGTTTNAYNYYGTQTKVAGSTLTNAYGLYLEDINQGLALNYALYTNAGKVRFGDLPAGSPTDNIVTVDANGVLTKTSATIAGAANNWGLTGNAGTTAGTNFIGTTDAQGLIFKVNNLQAGFLDPIQNNTAFGTSAGSSVVYPAGFQNTAFGFEALKNNTDRNNTAIGNAALRENTTGRSNTAVGNSALIANTTGFDNIAVGESLKSNTTGAGNIVVGKVALDSNVSGNNNTAMGWQTLRYSTGSENTAFGNAAANQLTAGDNNIAIGSKVQLASNTSSNQMNIGNTIFGTGMTGTLAAPAGNIGINNVAPIGTLSITGAAANPTIFSFAKQFNTAPNQFVANTDPTTALLGQKVNGYFGVGVNGSANHAVIGGINANPILGLTYNTDNTAQSTAYTGTVNQLIGIIGSPSVRSGTALNSYGALLSSYNSLTGTGTIRNSMGAYVTNVTAQGTDGSNPHNAYGVYIEDNLIATGGSTNNTWSFYSKAATAPSYLAGSLGVGTTAGVAPTNQLHVKATTDPVRIEGLQTAVGTNDVVVVDATGVLKTVPASTFGGGGAVDTTNDAWVNDSANTIVKLGTKSDGTARTAGTEVIVTDQGFVGIGTTTPYSGLNVVQNIPGSAIIGVANKTTATTAEARFVIENDADYGGIGIYSSTRATDPNAVSIFSPATSRGPILFRTGGQEKMRISGTGATTGFVGIGTVGNTPNSTLQVAGSVSANIRSLPAGQTLGATDYTVLAQGDATLPAADATNTGRIYNIINDTAGNITITGNFRQNGSNFTSYGLNASAGGRSFVVQSTGSAWAIISVQ